jgi:hypothetical protein
MKQLHFEHKTQLLHFLLEQDFFAVQFCQDLEDTPVYRLLRSGDVASPDCLGGKILRITDYETSEILERVLLGEALLFPNQFKL